MSDLLQHGRDSSLLVTVVTTQASNCTKEQTVLKEALAKFRKADWDHFHEPWIKEEHGITGYLWLCAD
jgi:hypothetical protein